MLRVSASGLQQWHKTSGGARRFCRTPLFCVYFESFFKKN